MAISFTSRWEKTSCHWTKRPTAWHSTKEVLRHRTHFAFPVYHNLQLDKSSSDNHKDPFLDSLREKQRWVLSYQVWLESWVDIFKITKFSIGANWDFFKKKSSFLPFRTWLSRSACASRSSDVERRRGRRTRARLRQRALRLLQLLPRRLMQYPANPTRPGHKPPQRSPTTLSWPWRSHRKAPAPSRW